MCAVMLDAGVRRAELTNAEGFGADAEKDNKDLEILVTEAVYQLDDDLEAKVLLWAGE